MKRYICAFFILLLMLSVSVSAVTIEEYALTVPLGEEYAVLTADNLSANAEVIEGLGHSLTSMRQYMNDNSLVLFAKNEDNSRQLQVFCKETEFSARVGDMFHLSDKDALSLVNRFVKVKTVSDLTLVVTGDTKYYEIVSSGTDSGGTYKNIQYVTVRGGKLYTLSFYDSKGTSDFTQHVSDVMAGVAITGERIGVVKGAENATEIIIISLLILLALAVVAFTVYSLIRDLAHKNESSDGFKISRRK